MKTKMKTFSQFIMEQSSTGYMAVGTKFLFYGTWRIDIKVVNKETSQIIVAKGADGADVNAVYSQVIKQLQEELASKKIEGVTLPTLDQLQDTSPRK